MGGVAAAALNGANEALVSAFLGGQIGFMDLPRRLARVLDKVEAGAGPGGSGRPPPHVGLWKNEPTTYAVLPLQGSVCASWPWNRCRHWGREAANGTPDGVLPRPKWVRLGVGTATGSGASPQPRRQEEM